MADRRISRKTLMNELAWSTDAFANAVLAGREDLIEPLKFHIQRLKLLLGDYPLEGSNE